MVVFVDLDHDAFNKRSFHKNPDPLFHPYVEAGKPPVSKLVGASSDSVSRPADVETDDDLSANPAVDSCQSQLVSEKQIPNRNSFSAALSCYPVIKEIARLVDLNTLDSLSQTCRQFHANLLPYRQQLVKQTLRCDNEYVETLVDLLKSGTVIPDSVKSVIRLLSQGAMSSGRLTTGKISKCARDMVAECRRCSTVVCRNCTAKPATTSGLGTGIGEGCQGVKCGRGEDCLAAQEIEMEVECEADESSGSPHGHSPSLENEPWESHNHSNDRWESREEEEPGYFRQEIIGIGGVVKQKAKKRVTVGSCVVEHEDERETGQYLVREEEGRDRSWCGWCWRVIPSKSEL
ncbi:hypothetical protein N8T08_009113 [Aspergillus melleus]|uniref:Uncharacterized protein n=1 Tax=Aspergillus melleus TaxID=138277 RepID=A0ACC3AUZ5_9EURO|nr:hypothetical protein N8T08_009113 [Aspergillus melleus]